MTQEQRMRATQLNINAIMAQLAPRKMSTAPQRSIQASRTIDKITTLQSRASINRKVGTKSLEK